MNRIIQINFGLSHQQLFKMGGVTGYGKYFMSYKPLKSLEKMKNLKKKAKLGLASVFSFSQYTLPT